MTCPRCQEETHVHCMSYFNTEEICLRCKADEHHCPNFTRAYDAETNAVRKREFNFPGIGLQPEDQAVLDARLRDHRFIKDVFEG